ncbi:hypothetical protein [Amycolatopsis taiwanensis]|uniref:Uncharacterized protein n=1 Tax=Amycolatopsis taiwanensis TaxID=342230 RepID=A0A9W6VES3_9PSEU|nr:hypothetical protein [Amycolatopsis taiwanensis]GLY64762.1 hypothetical protein Atai01_13810 [Amycolatopsis taiwanensis]
MREGIRPDTPDRLAFVACDGNATLLSLILTTWQLAGTNLVGQESDVLAYDQAARWLYVAAESGVVTVFDLYGRESVVSGMAPPVPVFPRSLVRWAPSSLLHLHRLPWSCNHGYQQGAVLFHDEER